MSNRFFVVNFVNHELLAYLLCAIGLETLAPTLALGLACGRLRFCHSINNLALLLILDLYPLLCLVSALLSAITLVADFWLW